MQMDNPYGSDVIDPAIQSFLVDNGNGLQSHVLTAGNSDNPCVLLLHGFPELAFSWRKIMLPLADAGFHVIAPDQRGYGRTTGSDNRFNADLAPFRLYNLAQDAHGVINAFGHESVHAVVGHDFGSPVAAWCALMWPEVFKSVALMSAPFAGTPLIATNAEQQTVATIDHQALSALEPARKHYQWYYSTADANNNMLHCPQGIHDFLRAYYHVKSADWKENKPYELASWGANDLATLPLYYVMREDSGMAETVAPEMPNNTVIGDASWLKDAELDIYAEEFGKTGFQGGLNWYRCVTSGNFNTELKKFQGKTIDVPAIFIAGASDWGIYQKPGEYQAMQEYACTHFQGSHLIQGAGHWVQQEQAQNVTDTLIAFFT